MERQKLNLFVLGLLILHTVLTGHFWLWNIFSVIPPFVFVLVFLGMCIWNLVLKNWYGYILVLVMMPLVFLHADVNVHGMFKSSRVIDDNISVFSLNTQLWYSGEIEEVISLMEKNPADIYQLQEILKPGTEGKPDILRFKEAFPDYFVASEAEFLTLSKYPIQDVKRPFGQDFMIADIKIKDTLVRFYNVHIRVHVIPNLLSVPLKFFANMRYRFYEREKQFAALEKSVEENVHPYFLSGDFNTTSSMGKLWWLQNHTTDTIVSNHDPIPVSWNARKLNFWRIDHAYVSENILPVTHTFVDPEAITDHMGMYIEVALE